VSFFLPRFLRLLMNSISKNRPSRSGEQLSLRRLLVTNAGFEKPW